MKVEFGTESMRWDFYFSLGWSGLHLEITLGGLWIVFSIQDMRDMFARYEAQDREDKQ